MKPVKLKYSNQQDAHDCVFGSVAVKLITDVECGRIGIYEFGLCFEVWDRVTWPVRDKVIQRMGFIPP